tara:strand:- start:635 stop:1696 length:1062 start_codon:yes stop_codon:yes gene_type:complete
MKKIFTLIILLISLISYPQKLDTNYVKNQIKNSINQLELNLKKEINKLESEIIKNSSLTDSLNKSTLEILNSNNTRIKNLSNEFSGFQKKFGKIKKLQKSLNNLISSLNIKLKSSTDRVNNLGNTIIQMESYTDSISDVMVSIDESVNKTVQDIEKEHLANEENKKQIDSVNRSFSKKQKFSLLVVGLAILLIIIIYFILNKKWSKRTEELNKKQNEIFEKQIQDSQQIAEWLSRESTTVLAQSDPDHSFAKRVADEIVRITTNLSRMDESIKGYKQLKASVRKLTQSLNANDYEIEELLGKPWDSGMNLQANFVIDEKLKESESIISRIIKPQINYKGKLIQAAQVEVSQGE